MDFFQLLFDAALDLLNTGITFGPVQFILVSAAVLLLVIVPISKILHFGD